MSRKIVALACILFVSVEGHLVRRDVTTSPPPNIFEPFHKNLEQFKNCIDQHMANTVEQINEKQLMPVLEAVADSLNRITKAFDDLTATTKRPKQIN